MIEHPFLDWIEASDRLRKILIECEYIISFDGVMYLCATPENRNELFEALEELRESPVEWWNIVSSIYIGDDIHGDPIARVPSTNYRKQSTA